MTERGSIHFCTGEIRNFAMRGKHVHGAMRRGISFFLEESRCGAANGLFEISRCGRRFQNRMHCFEIVKNAQPKHPGLFCWSSRPIELCERPNS